MKWTSKPRFITQKIFDNDLVAIHRIKTTLARNKPAYARMCILELSKVLMHEFHYNYIKKNFGNKLRLLFTDTVSLMYEIETENVYDDFRKNNEMFDFSNYSAKSNYYDDSNALVDGKMKDEMGSTAIEEIVGLKPKTYLILVSNSSEYEKAKGANKNTVAKISFSEYKDVLLNNKCLKHVMNRTQSKNHMIGTYKTNNIFISSFDVKIYILHNGVDALALRY